MAKVKNKRANHDTKRGRYYAERGREMPGHETQGRNGSTGKQERSGNAGRADRSANAGRPSRPTKPKRAERTDFAGGWEKTDRNDQPDTNLIIGRNPVTEALKSGREVDKLMISSREGSMIKILALAKEQSVPVIMVEKAALDRIASGRPHQGVVAYVSPYDYSEMEDVFALAKERNEAPFLVLLDNLEDPHNLGAIIRSAECAGAHGVILPERRAAGLGPAAAKAAAGALDCLPIARVKNLNRTIDELKQRGVWVIGTAMDGEDALTADLTGPVALVIGSEGEGISHLTLQKCDRTVTLPMKGQIVSLNASVAAGILMYEIVRARAK